MILIDGKQWRPISFVDELIRAILEDLKTETRRIARIEPTWSFPSPARYIDGFVYRWGPAAVNDPKAERVACPYGKAGDRLWVRERFVAMKRNGEVCKIQDADAVVFRDGFGKWKDSGITFQVDNIETKWTARTWRPPMHLPFWAYRIGLEVKSVSIERLHEITEAGAIGEGFAADDPSEDRTEREFDLSACPHCGGLGVYQMDGLGGTVFDADCKMCDTARGKFRIKWDQINGKRIDKSSGKPLTWDCNPFVWRIEFKRLTNSLGLSQ